MWVVGEGLRGCDVCMFGEGLRGYDVSVWGVWRGLNGYVDNNNW